MNKLLSAPECRCLLDDGYVIQLRRQCSIHVFEYLAGNFCKHIHRKDEFTPRQVKLLKKLRICIGHVLNRVVDDEQS